ncbi:unnamed protein product [Paramecium pentaurelia]|uniref:Transmembrane protein n=1 Tax=Paramecium pentaurelia TaxID=43138 RepID=A0A8S1VSL9_9CILI|nr:unnamed protein product [Paramecium pentaurelia]
MNNIEKQQQWDLPFSFQLKGATQINKYLFKYQLNKINNLSTLLMISQIEKKDVKKSLINNIDCNNKRREKVFNQAQILQNNFFLKNSEPNNYLQMIFIFSLQQNKCHKKNKPIQQIKTQMTEAENSILVQQEGNIKPEEFPLNSTKKQGNESHKDKEQKAQFSIFKYLKPTPDPALVWEPHQNKNLISELQELIENRFNEVKRSSSIYKYYAKIGFQVFIYLLNILELIFTLVYDSYNELWSYFKLCYIISILFCVLLHCGVWMYTYKFREVEKQNICIDILNYIYYLFMGALSYFKLAPFIYYFKRDKSIKQFSFSEINKYLQLSGEDKFRNPCMLFKKRTKPVNIFRDLIFHRVALVSMMITMTIQTIPQIFIQGFYNTVAEKWDGFNVISFLLLISNLIYYFMELQFIVFTTTYRQMQTELQFKLKKIKLKFIQETKQLLKADVKYIGFVQSFYFHIDSSKFSSYQKKRCMIQIISFLMKQKKYKNIEFHFIDQYDDVTLQYLANCFKLIKVEKISLLYHDENCEAFLQNTFKNIPNLTLSIQNEVNFDQLWNNDLIDLNATEEKVTKIQFIENPKITTGYQALQLNQFMKNNQIQISPEFQALMSIYQRGSTFNRGISNGAINQSQIIDYISQGNLETSQDIIDEAQTQIAKITKRTLFEESFGSIQLLMILYDYYEAWNKLNSFQATIQSIWSFFNGFLQIISLVYLNNGDDIFIYALIVLTIVNPVLQMVSFAVFQQRVFKDFSTLKQISFILLFAIFNFFKIWDIVMICLYLCVQEFTDVVKRDFSSVGYIKFKSYASKFQGSLATQVFNYETVQIDSKKIFQIKSQPFYEAVMWRTNVEEALNKIPQFFVYILSLFMNQLNIIWVMSFIQQLKESIEAIKNILEVVIKDYLIPALILGSVSIDSFFQSMLYLSSISNQILLEYPKSFQIISKVQEQYLREKLTFKINLKTLNFSNYKELKKQKMLAQFRYVLAKIQNILEIDQAQSLFSMGSELNDLIRCLKVSQIFQLKLNFYFDEIVPAIIPYVNTFINNCPKQLQFLQIQVEATNVQQMKIVVERKDVLTAFSYSFFQILQQYKDNSRVFEQQNLNIDKVFLNLDRYNFDQFYFEVSGLILKNCHQLFEQFTQLKVFKASILNNTAIQTFEFSSNLKSKQLEILDITFENILLDFQEFPFNNLNCLIVQLFNKYNILLKKIAQSSSLFSLFIKILLKGYAIRIQHQLNQQNFLIFIVELMLNIQYINGFITLANNILW